MILIGEPGHLCTTFGIDEINIVCLLGFGHQMLLLPQI
jgi:hypothetical protein